ncbi:putative ribosomal large subunit pseudouridine synthase SVR1, chloroplastic isoform X2 [Spinacia oleracea]|nr:putative ribosomal large subunit pseudouridine synthase SVR1, chloroplastic isoform X2 [Spinacia oleracea]
MAAFTFSAASTTLAISTLHLTRASFLSIHRTCLHTLSPRLRISLNSFPSSIEEHEPLPSSKVSAPWIVHALPTARSFQSVADGGARKKAVTVKKKEKRTAEEPRYSKAARRFYNERFGEKPQRLAKVLAAAGVASRRSSEELIFQGKVTVNGSVCDTPQTRVDPAKDIIYVKGSRLPKKLPSKVYLALNKPKGYICSSGEKELKSILCLFDDFLKSWDKQNPGEPKPRLFTVGRLDVATTGLIIVTNDGDFAQRVSHPSSNLTKEYIATVNGEVHKRQLVAIIQGTTIDGVHCTPEYVELLPRQQDILRARLRIVVNEGRNHEVRELVKKAGLEIHSLKRIRIGGFKLSSGLG